MITQQRKEELMQLARDKHPFESVMRVIEDMNLEEQTIFIREVEKLDLKLEIKETANKLDIDNNTAGLLVMSKQAHEYLGGYIERQGLENTCASKMVDRLGDAIEKIAGDNCGS